MKDLLKLSFAASLVFALSACTTGETLEGEETATTEEVAQGTDTDVVPELTDPAAEGALAEAPPAEGSGDQAGLPPVEPAGIGAPPAEDHLTQAPPAETPVDPAAAPMDAAAPPPAETAAAEPAPAPEHSSPELNAAPVPTETAASAPATSTGEFRDYEVQPGDTLMRIAYEVYGDVYSWRKILDANTDKLNGPGGLSKGMTLKVEKTDFTASQNGEKYLIKWGDTLGVISDDVYGTTAKWKRLWENNRQLIKDPNRIFAGFYLYYEMTPQDQTEKDQFLQQKRLPASAQGG